jgi:hypothetical protein
MELSANEKLRRLLLLSGTLTLRHRECDPFEAQVRLGDKGYKSAGSFIHIVRNSLITDEKLGLLSRGLK